jgi:cytochrome c biogenesis protein CcmG/thiol:disulfide interchange protein DsbE
MSTGTEEAPPRARRWLIALPALIFAGLAALLAIRLYAGDPSRLPSALVGRPAPDFALPAVEGLSKPGLTRADLGQGRVTVINVWASWCAPCREEHPILMELARRDDIDIVGIAYKDRPENSARFLGALGNPFARIGADEKGRAAIDWGVYGVPETFVVDGKGTVAFKHVGALTEASVTNVLLPEIEKAKAR